MDIEISNFPIRIAGYIQDSIVDGPGLRLTVFTQGCPHRCKGCHNPETWDYEGGTVIDVGNLEVILASNPLISGITLSGGEPFMQSEACSILAKTAHVLGKNVWVYTGYTYEDLIHAVSKEGNIEKLLVETDVLVDGCFIEEKRSLSLKFRGSANQRVIDMKKTKEAGKVVLWEEG